MTSVYSIDNIKSRLLADTKAFEVLINTIPAKFYISEDIDDTLEHDSKYTFGKQKNSKNEAKKNALLQKKIKFDPSVVKDTVSLIEQKFNSKRSRDEDEDSSDSEEFDSDMSVDEEDEEEEEDEVDCEFQDQEQEAPAQKIKPTQIKSFSDVSREELLKKLHERISAQRSLRKADDPKKAEVLKQKRKNKNSKKAIKKTIEATKKGSQIVQEKVVVDESVFHNKKDIKKTADTIKDEGDFTFSKFEFAGVEKKKRGPATARDALTKIENEQKKLATLKETDIAKAKQLEEKQAWRKALQLSSGQKIRDDPKLLKKTIRRIEKKKNKSSEQWQDRKTKVKDDEAEKQSKREANLQARKDAAKNKKMGKKVKKAKAAKRGGSSKSKSFSKPGSKSGPKPNSKTKKQTSHT